jgi:hypothetical protein
MKDDTLNQNERDDNPLLNDSMCNYQLENIESDFNENDQAEDGMDVIIPLPKSENHVNSNIPFISKAKRDGKTKAKNSPVKKEKNASKLGEPDEIDVIIKNVSKNKSNSRGNVIVEKGGEINFEDKPKTSEYGNSIKNYLPPIAVVVSEIKKPANTKTQKIRQQEEFPTGIDPYEINKQEEVTNSDLILCILELCLNPGKYELNYSPKSKVFWDGVLKRENLKNIFRNFKSETLKKYWLILFEAKNYTQAVSIVNKHRELINNRKIK